MSLLKHEDEPMRKIKHGRLAASCASSCCLELKGLSVKLEGDSILEDVSFHLHCGEIVALIGPNGAGKSSLFRSILGQMPYQGSITFSPAGGPAIRLADGTVTGGKRPLVGYVPQAPSFDRGDPVSVLDFFTAATAKWPVWLPVPKTPGAGGGLSGPGARGGSAGQAHGGPVRRPAPAGAAGYGPGAGAPYPDSG